MGLSPSLDILKALTISFGVEPVLCTNGFLWGNAAVLRLQINTTTPQKGHGYG